MNNILLNLSDKVDVIDKSSLSIINKRMSAGPKKTKIVFTNADTGEILDTRENKVVITGSQFNAASVFGIEDAVDFPSYNSEMGLDNTTGSEGQVNKPIVCLFCVSDAGCGSKPNEVYIANYTDRIKPAPANPVSVEEFASDMIMPFRYVDAADDISDNLRQYYFGRKTFDQLGKIGYYFKTFDTTPQLHLKYADGTEITKDVFTITSDQLAECYIELRLRITRLDFRDYFENVLGWDKARISSLSLCFAWYDDTIDEYKYYQDIKPYTYLPFSYQWLVDTNVAIDVLYQIYY